MAALNGLDSEQAEFDRAQDAVSDALTIADQDIQDRRDFRSASRKPLTNCS